MGAPINVNTVHGLPSAHKLLGGPRSSRAANMELGRAIIAKKVCFVLLVAVEDDDDDDDRDDIVADGIAGGVTIADHMTLF